MINEDHTYTVKINLDAENSSHTKIIKKINKNSIILEIGPGDGSMTQFLKNNWNCTVDCIEIDGKYRDKLSKLTRNTHIFDIEKVDLKVLFKEYKYDYIICADVLEHLYDPWKLLTDLKSLLKHQGKIIASIPNISNGAIVLSLISGFFPYSDKGLLDKTHIRFFTRYSIYELFEKNGLIITSLETTKIQPEKSEFYGYFKHTNLPASLKDLLFSMKDFDTYQFIIESIIKNDKENFSKELIDLNFKNDLNEVQVLKNEIELFKNSKAYKLSKIILRIFGIEKSL